MKILTVVGARPQFIKAAVGSREIRKEHREILVHTGQHYDVNMSDIFFKELDIPSPDYNLGIAGGSHAQMTARMMIALDEVMQRERPDALLVYGDTNSTMAAAVVAVKLHVPVFHVEAGNRFGTLDSPEEANRIVTDHLSTLCFACVDSALASLRRENLSMHSYWVGDPMYDAFLYYKDRTDNRDYADVINFDGNSIRIPKEYYYLTCHRQENTVYPERLRNILRAMNSLDAPVIYPVHPRNRSDVQKACQEMKYHNILCTQPVGYLSSIGLIRSAKKIVTDSGGVQREAFFSGIQCVTVLDFTVWPETMVDNRNQLSNADMDDIRNKLSRQQTIDDAYQPFGDGRAAQRVSETINRWREELA